MEKSGFVSDRSNVAAELRQYAAFMDSLISLLESNADREKLTEDYKRLKHDLKERCSELKRKESDRSITPTEKAFLLPALIGASVQLRPATNSNPKSAAWHSAVYEAKIDIEHMLSQLKQ